MKRTITFILAILLMLSMASCNTENETPTTTAIPKETVNPIVGADSYNADLTLEMLGYDVLSEQEIENLYVLGKVWGFLKYYHPNIRAGNFDWDMELMSNLEPFSQLQTAEERDQFLLAWIKALGEYGDEVEEESELEGDVVLEPDHSWIDLLADDGLKEELNKIINTKRGDEQYYSSVNNLEISSPNNEVEYDIQLSSNPAIRLVTLFRYWSRYYYYSPNVNITDQPWDTVLTEMIPEFVLGETESDFVENIWKLVAYTGDRHTYYMGTHADGNIIFGQYTLPLKVRFFDDNLAILDSYTDSRTLEDMGLVAGDIITHIDGRPTIELYDDVSQYLPTSNEYNAGFYICLLFLFRTDSQHTDLTVLRDGESVDVSVETIDNTYQRNQTYRSTNSDHYIDTAIEDLGDGILYLNLDLLTTADISNNRGQILSSKGLIIDKRNYPAYDVKEKLINMLTSEPINGAYLTLPIANTPGAFYRLDRMMGSYNDEQYEGQVVILVDELTKSSTEYTTMFMRQLPNVTVIGKPTAGADGDVVIITLPGGISTYYSSLGVFYPDGTQTQRVGLIPDIEVELTIEGMIAGRDEVVEAAVDYLNSID